MGDIVDGARFGARGPDCALWGAGDHRVDLFEQARHEGLLIGIIRPVDNPAPGSTDAPSAHMEYVNGCVEFIGDESEDIRVGTVVEDNDIAFEDRFEGTDIVAQFGCGFEVEVEGSLLHLRFEIADDRPGPH